MLYTYDDQISSLTDFLGNYGGGESTQRDVRRAIRDAFNKFSSLHSWDFLKKNGYITSTGQYNTGTIQYLQSSGTYPYQVTLTGGTWPTWANYGFLNIDGSWYEVARYYSPSIITLNPASNPGVNYVPLTSWYLYQVKYPLPSDFDKMDRIRFNHQYELRPLRAGDLAYANFGRFIGGSPGYYSIYGNTVIGQRAINFFPVTTSVNIYEYIYSRRLRPMIYYGVSDGTVTINSGTSVVTGTGTKFLTAYQGSSIRFSADSVNAPTNEEDINPAAFETTIDFVTGSNNLTILGIAPSTFTNVKYVISDYVDIEQGCMLELWRRLCERNISINRKFDPQDRQIIKGIYEKALLEAQEQDALVVPNRVAGDGRWYGPTWQDYLAQNDPNP